LATKYLEMVPMCVSGYECSKEIVMRIAVAACLSLLFVFAARAVAADEAAATRAMIEADWLHLDQLRGNPATAKPVQPPTVAAPLVGLSKRIDTVIQRGLKLAQSQRILGADVAVHEQTLRDFAMVMQSLA
jgi:hypothetical protein